MLNQWGDEGILPRHACWVIPHSKANLWRMAQIAINESWSTHSILAEISVKTFEEVPS